MANQPENPTPEPETQYLTPDEAAAAETTPPAPAPESPRRLLDRVPPRYRKKKWLIGGAVTLAALGLALFQCGNVAIRAFTAPETEPEPAAEATAPTPATASASLSDRASRLPGEYAFSHFVNELDDRYEQKGIATTVQETEAEIMADVPYAVGYLLRHYADGVCAERDNWHRIPGRLARMLRVGDVPLPELPGAEPPQ